MTTTTVQILSQITDDAFFERLATAILRDARPEYHGLIHCGINSDGKTVKSPLDGIGYSHLEGSHLLAVHHTTCKRTDLPKKWLHDPSQSKAKKKTTPTGDFIKAREIVTSERTKNSSLRATLVLTTNREPPEELVREVGANASAADIIIDFWSVSRLAHHLDHTASGQWIRRDFLGIEAQRISPDLLRELSRRSLVLGQPNDDPTLWVPRALDQTVEDAIKQQDIIGAWQKRGLLQDSQQTCRSPWLRSRPDTSDNRVCTLHRAGGR